MSKSQKSPCCTYDVTIPADKFSPKELRDIFKEHCKKYCFQKEEGEKTGFVHYQCRISLKTKKRLHEAIKLFPKINGGHFSLTASTNKDNDFYVMKEDTRIEGPFTDQNEIIIPQDVLDMKVLWSWQDSMWKILIKRDTTYRLIHLVYCPGGGTGKTRFTRWMCYNADAEEIPFANDHKDIMRFAYDLGEKQIYLVDMPRAINKQKLNSLYAGIEKLKDGYCYDDRYKLQVRRFFPPQICVFTNEEPDLRMLSRDRWRLWTINHKKELKPYIKKEYKKGNAELEFLNSDSETSYETTSESS